MGLASEMKNLTEDMLSSFKQRIQENEELVNDVQKTLDGFRLDHRDMAATLRASLATGEKNRMKEADIFMKKTVKDHKEMAAALRSDLAMDEKTRMKEFVDLMKSINERISEVFTYTDDLLAMFDKEHQDMAAALRAGLDKDEVERLKEFVALMKNINEEISGIFTYTQDLLGKFDKEHLEMSVELRKNLSDGEVERIKEFVPLMKNINEEILRIFTYTHDLLEKFDKEHLEMSAELRNELSTGEVERLKEFNIVMKGIQNDVKNLKKAVAELLGDFSHERGDASAAWEKMSVILAQLRKTAVAPPKQAVKKEVKKEAPVAPVAAKVEAPVEAVKEAPVEAKVETPVKAVKEIPVEEVKETPVNAVPKPKAEPKPVVPMALEAKVIDFINKHPKGVRISEMEEPLGETRMKLGFIAKNLLNEGKVLKIENIYYPKTKIEG